MFFRKFACQVRAKIPAADGRVVVVGAAAVVVVAWLWLIHANLFGN